MKNTTSTKKKATLTAVETQASIPAPEVVVVPGVPRDSVITCEEAVWQAARDAEDYLHAARSYLDDARETLEDGDTSADSSYARELFLKVQSSIRAAERCLDEVHEAARGVRVPIKIYKAAPAKVQP